MFATERSPGVESRLVPIHIWRTGLILCIILSHKSMSNMGRQGELSNTVPASQLPFSGMPKGPLPTL